ncbi:MAG: hypothetical protein ACTHNM_06350 [Dyella sp.]|uniref:hypothetical protein n=1 Tax=Dyella sp. TaxID=1869338 RepID=UPI003F7ED3A7
MSLKFLVSIALVLAASAASSPAIAQTVSEKGMGSATYGWRLSPADRQAAIQKAEMNAIERYVADTDAARSRIFDEKRGELATHVGDYILGTTVIDEQTDKSTKSYNVVIRADINGTRLLNDLGGGSSSSTDMAKQQHAMLTFLFVARSQASVQSFDAKVYKRADVDSSSAKKAREGESIKAASVGTSDNLDEHSSIAVTTGGSTTRKADKVEWTINPASEINTVMTGKFADAGYDVIEADQVEGASNGLLNIQAVQDAYSHGNDLPPAMARNATQGVRTAGIGLFALGTLDVGMQDVDPVSGNTRVFVTVTGKVYDVSGRFARTLSSVGPVQFAGLGPDATVARTNALKNAAQMAAQQMVDELTNKGVH